MGINETLFNTVSSFVHDYPVLAAVVPFFADTLPTVLVVGLVIFLLIHKHEERGMHSVVTLFSAAAIGFGFSQFLKSIFPIARPFASLDITPLISASGTYSSFPSGHVMLFATIATVMWFYHKGISTILFISAFLIGLARIAGGIHWPMDVLGGLLIGVFVGLVVHHGYYALLGVLGKAK